MAKKRTISKQGEILKVKRLSPQAELPAYALESDVGFDFRANESITLGPFEQKEVKTGLAIEIPEGFIGLVRDRAGIVTEMAVHVVAGTYGPAYRGEVGIKMINFGEDNVKIEKGMRIAQMIIMPIKKFKIFEVKELSNTDRNDKTSGSTGLN